ncbi:MAG: ATP-binding protein [Kiritimatiellae bacterium]|nr:ATP-binding protein [Kiritimatiellia bacterium]
MKIAIASGKGGTGKTTLAVNLAFAAGAHTQLVDCDVEEPNSHLFIQAKRVAKEVVTLPVPLINEELCIRCGKCARFCEFSALAALGSIPMVFPEMCHGCGGCMRICEQGAISEVRRRIGTVESFDSNGVTLVHGCLDIGVAMAPPLINAVKKQINASGLVILDAPPGTTCPAVAAVKGADYVVLVTEPTPFGLNDLKLAVAMTRELGVPFGVVINRAGVGDDKVQRYCENESIHLFDEIPDDRRVAEAYSRGELIIDAVPGYRELFVRLLDKISEAAAAGKAEL